MMSDILHENDNYTVSIGKTIYGQGDWNCYQIVNKRTGIVEEEFTILPKAIVYADQFSNTLKAESPIMQPPEGIALN